MRTVLVTGPATEPIDLDTAKSHLEVVGTSKDTDITALIKVARLNVERYLKRALITQTWKVYYDCFHYEMILPYPPLVSVTSVKYLNQSAALTTVDAATYFVDTSEPGMIRRGYNTVYPEVQDGAPNGVVIEYVAGYGAASAVPVDIVHAIKLLIADYFDNRGEIVVGTISTRIPNHVKNLIHDYRMYDFAD